MRKAKKNVLILTSGGIDSTACIRYYLNLGFDVQGLFIDYGQKSHKKEAESIVKISEFFNVKISKYTLQTTQKFKSGLISGRNLFLLSTAILNYRKSGLIALGIHAGTNYNDCTPSFIDAVQKVVDIYFAGSVIIDAPFRNFTKNEIWNYCKDNDVPLQLTYSCENGVVQPCNKCNSCKDLNLLYESTQ